MLEYELRLSSITSHKIEPASLKKLPMSKYLENAQELQERIGGQNWGFTREEERKVYKIYKTNCGESTDLQMHE